MKKLLLILLFPATSFANGPIFQHKNTFVQQEFENVYQDLLTKLSTVTVPSNSSVAAGSTNYIQNTANPTTATQVFSVSSGTITNGTVTNLKVSTEQWKGFGILPILQIQSYTTVVSSVIANTVYVNSNLTGSITPKLSTSKILVWAAGDCSQDAGAVGYATLARDGTNLAGSGGFHILVSNNNYFMNLITYDSPATTSAVTYSVQFKSNTGAASIRFPITDGGSLTSTAVLTLIEIAQ